jgi:hypothetical protein
MKDRKEVMRLAKMAQELIADMKENLATGEVVTKAHIEQAVGTAYTLFGGDAAFAKAELMRRNRFDGTNEQSPTMP